MNGPRRTYSVPGFASPQVTPSHAASLPQLSARSSDQPPLTQDGRQASLYKINLAKKHASDGKSRKITLHEIVYRPSAEFKMHQQLIFNHQVGRGPVDWLNDSIKGAPYYTPWYVLECSISQFER